MILVSSMGGVGSTAIIEHLEGKIEVNPAHGAYNPLKHALRPPQRTDIQRAVFIFGDPAAAATSLFRRGLDAAHHRNVYGLKPPLNPLIDEDPWTATVQRFRLRETAAGTWVDHDNRYASDIGALNWLADRKAARRQAIHERDASTRRQAGYRDFEDVLEKNLDPFGWHTQLPAWSKGSPAYPVLIIRYSILWSRCADILKFLGLPPSHAADFPAWRPRIGLDSEPLEMQAKIRSWAAAFEVHTATWPDVFEVTLSNLF